MLLPRQLVDERQLAMDAGHDARPAAEQAPQQAAEQAPRRAAIERFGPVAKIVLIDAAAPLATYALLRSQGVPATTALILSAVAPALGLGAGLVRRRRIDVVGVLVLAGIVVGTVLGLVSHNARLVLMEGSVPTAIFAVACLSSLSTAKPLMFGFALEFVGRDSAKGREMTELWQYENFRRVFRVITAVWGVGFVLEVAMRTFVIYATSTGTALAISKAAPYVFTGVLSAWTFAYATRLRRKYERDQQAAVHYDSRD